MLGLAELSPLAQAAFAAAMVLLIYTWLETGGKVVQWLVANIPNPSIPTGFFGDIHIFGWLISALDDFDTRVQNAFYFYMDATKAGWNQWVHTSAAFVAAITEDYDFLAAQTGNALHFLRRWKIPALITAVAGPLGLAVYEIQKHISGIKSAAGRVEHTVTRVIEHPPPKITYITNKIAKGASLVAVAGIAAEIPTLWHGVDDAESIARKALRRAEDAVKRAGLAGVVGITVAGLVAAGLGWVRCSNVAKAGRQLCAMDRGLLEALLAGSLLYLSRISLRDFATYLIGVTEELSGEILDGFTETHDVKVPKFKGYTGTLG